MHPTDALLLRLVAAFFCLRNASATLSFFFFPAFHSTYVLPVYKQYPLTPSHKTHTHTRNTHTHTHTHTHSNIMRNLQRALAVASRARTFGRWCYICVLILLYVRTDTAIYVSSYSSYCYICVLILLYMLSSYCYICVRLCVSAYCYMYVSAYYYICVRILYVCSYCYICVRLYVSAYCYIYVSAYYYVSAYCYICVSAYYYRCVCILLCTGVLVVMMHVSSCRILC